MPRFTFHLFLLVAGLAFLSACSVTDRVTYTDGEGRVPPEVIKRITSKPTSRAWVMSQLGKPMHIDRIETLGRQKELHYEIYTYRFSRTFIRSAQVFYVFKSGAREEEEEYFHVAFENGLSQRAWLDHLSRPHIASRLHQEKSKVRSTKVASKSHADRLVEPEKNSRVNWKLPILKRWFGNENVPQESDQKMKASGEDGALGTTQETMNDTAENPEQEANNQGISPQAKSVGGATNTGEVQTRFVPESEMETDTIDVPSIDIEGDIER
ncbi:MAG: hypothetical protein K6L76_00955 [Agarilytica sp.]